MSATQLISAKSRFPELQLPLTPFELTAPVLGLLLVFRTDTAYDRFNLGSQLTWEITASLRTLMRRLVAYTSPAAFSEAEHEAAQRAEAEQGMPHRRSENALPLLAGCQALICALRLATLCARAALRKRQQSSMWRNLAIIVLLLSMAVAFGVR